MYLRARWYAPELGRFVSRDPLEGFLPNPRAQHPYLYGEDNPASRVDRSGLSPANLFNSSGGYSYDGRALYGGPTPTLTPIPTPQPGARPPTPPTALPAPRPSGSPAFRPPDERLLTDADEAVTAFELGRGGYLSLQTRASTFGRVLRTSPDPAARSLAAQYLRSAGRLSALARNPVLKFGGRVLIPLGFALTAGANFEQGQDPLQALGRAGFETAGGFAGGIIGSAACAGVTVASEGFGIVTCPVLVVGGAALFEELGAQVANRLFGPRR